MAGRGAGGPGPVLLARGTPISANEGHAAKFRQEVRMASETGKPFQFRASVGSWIVRLQSGREGAGVSHSAMPERPMEDAQSTATASTCDSL
uniref:Uncharacterized protein n=1 Tax=Zooxanthella nutricula TaxID=1333877 RepID=A0A6U9F6W2_9DINO